MQLHLVKETKFTLFQNGNMHCYIYSYIIYKKDHVWSISQSTVATALTKSSKTFIWLHWKVPEHITLFEIVWISRYTRASCHGDSSLWPSDAIGRRRYWSTLLQVRAWCPTAPSPYLNQCWLTINEILWYLFQGYGVSVEALGCCLE